MSAARPQLTHITRKNDVYYWRRRLPGLQRGEVSLSLRTRRFREAEHRAAILDAALREAKARGGVSSDREVQAALRAYLRQALESLDHPEPEPVLIGSWEPDEPPPAFDPVAARARRRRAAMAASQQDIASVALTALGIVEEHDLPATLHRRVALGVLEANLRVAEEALRRARGEGPTLTADSDAEPFALIDAPPDAPAPLAHEAQGSAASAQSPALPVQSTSPEGVGRPAPAPPPPTTEAPSRPLASSLVEPYFVRRETIDRTRHQVMGQERATLRLFFEVCGDRPPADYQRGDVTHFLDTLRRMPALYNRSRKAPPKSVADMIAEADASNATRLTDKTVKRHLTALSQFFRFALDRGQISVAAHGELVKAHRFKASKKARDQRDAWTPEELTALFKSPIWTGRDAAQVTKPGPHIIRDAKFWLPILAVFHGGRLEEFADLYGRDLQCDAGTWFLNIVETEADEEAGTKGRSLKTGNATRALPLHPEVIRLGFVQYVREKAPQPDDPLFPDLPPQGKDGRRGARFTRDFIYYRQQVGVYRRGVGMHSFRHTAITRLTDAITDFQQKRHRDYLMGHGGGATEGDVRYDKGPGLKAIAATLALLRYPEVDLSHLHVSDPHSAPSDPAFAA